jgi:hypothetical protein
MATNFPASADDATTVGGDNLPAAGTELSDTLSGHPSHAVMHENVGDAIQAVEAKVGTGSSAPAADTVLIGTGSGTSSWSTVSTGMIGDDQVTQAKMANDAVGADELASAAVVWDSLASSLKSQVRTMDPNGSAPCHHIEYAGTSLHSTWTAIFVAAGSDADGYVTYGTIPPEYAASALNASATPIVGDTFTKILQGFGTPYTALTFHCVTAWTGSQAGWIAVAPDTTSS